MDSEGNRSLGEVYVLRRRDDDSVVFGFKVRRQWSGPGRRLIRPITDSLREGERSCGETGLQR
jgi:hypothetical protein